MLLDLLDLVIILSDLLESLQALLVNQAENFSLSTFCVLTIVGLVLYACWVFTEVPNLPNPPRPPYVIQIRATNGVNSNISADGRQNLSDVRLLSSGSIDTVFSVIPSLGHTRLGAQQQQPSTSAGTSSQNTAEEPNQNRTVFFGFLHRPLTRALIPVRPSPRANFAGSNVVVYHHQVDVYHSVRPESSSAEPVRADENAQQGVPGPPEGIQLSRDISDVERTPNSSGRSSINPVRDDPSLTQAHSVVINSQQTQGSAISETRLEWQSGAEASNSAGSVASSASGHVEKPNPEDAKTSQPEVADGRLNSREFCGSTEASPTCKSVNAEKVETSTSASGSHTRFHNPDCGNSNAMSSSSVLANNLPNSPASVSSGSEDVRITIKFLNDTHIDITTQLEEKVFDFKRRHFATELDENKIVRLIFNGRVLDNDGKTLREFGVFDQCVMHCLIITPEVSGRQPDSGSFNRTDTSQNSRFSRSIQGGPEPGLFFVSILGVVLLFLWFICFHFGQQLFTQSAVISLVVLTAVFVIGLVALYLPVQPNH